MWHEADCLNQLCFCSISQYRGIVGQHCLRTKFPGLSVEWMAEYSSTPLGPESEYCLR